MSRYGNHQSLAAFNLLGSIFNINAFRVWYSYLKSFSNNVFIELNYKILHGAAFAIGLLGFTLSVIWVLMAKGSKAWYEVYAKAISDFEEEFKHELGIPQIYLMGKVDFRQRYGEKDDDGFYCNKK